jgi:hypothetical protein
MPYASGKRLARRAGAKRRYVVLRQRFRAGAAQHAVFMALRVSRRADIPVVCMTNCGTAPMARSPSLQIKR